MKSKTKTTKTRRTTPNESSLSRIRRMQGGYIDRAVKLVSLQYLVGSMVDVIGAELSKHWSVLI